MSPPDGRRPWSRHRDRTPAHPTAAPSIAGYADLVVIGRGATATVYRATQHEFDRAVAVKVLNVDVSDRRAQRRFQRERALNGRLSSHPNVVTVLDAGFVDGRYPYLVMELFELGSISDRLAADGPLPIEQALHVGVRIAGALESAHRAGVLHRDVKPQNVLLSRFGEPALADFGIATLLEMEQSLTSALTPVHAAPELLEGSDPTPASDVYALASTVYTMLAGVAPFAGPPGEGLLAQLLRITTSELPALRRPDVPDSLVAALRQATARRPAERTSSAADFGAALQGVQEELGGGVTPLPVEALGAVDTAPAAGAAPRVDVAPVGDTTATVEPNQARSSSPRPGAGAPPPARPVAEHRHQDTVVARQTLPPPDPPPTRRRWVVPVIAGAAVVAGAAAAVLIVGALEDDEPGSVASTVPRSTNGAATSRSAAPVTSQAIDPVAARPDDVTASTSTGSLVVSWTAGDSSLSHVVSVYDDDAATPAIQVTARAGEGSRVVEEADVAALLCVLVGAFLGANPDGTANISWAEAPVAVNDAVCVIDP